MAPEMNERCGKVRVNLAPLLMMIGALMSCENAPRVEDIVEMLGLELDRADS